MPTKKTEKQPVRLDEVNTGKFVLWTKVGEEMPISEDEIRREMILLPPGFYYFMNMSSYSISIFKLTVFRRVHFRRRYVEVEIGSLSRCGGGFEAAILQNIREKIPAPVLKQIPIYIPLAA